jgi:hypothetical protein
MFEVEQNGEVNGDAYEPQMKDEQVGVVHLVHGWIQQGQPAKVYFLH